MNTENTYNGFTNYQTWAVASWLLDKGFKDKLPVVSNAVELAEILEDLIQNDNPLIEDASMFADLLHHAITQVNFQEIAENFLTQ